MIFFLRMSKQNKFILTSKDAHVKHLAEASRYIKILVDAHKKLTCQRIQCMQNKNVNEGEDSLTTKKPLSIPRKLHMQTCFLQTSEGMFQTRFLYSKRVLFHQRLQHLGLMLHSSYVTQQFRQAECHQLILKKVKINDQQFAIRIEERIASYRMTSNMLL